MLLGVRLYLSPRLPPEVASSVLLVQYPLPPPPPPMVPPSVVLVTWNWYRCTGDSVLMIPAIARTELPDYDQDLSL